MRPLLLALALVALALLAVACQGGGAVDLADLAMDAERYDGRDVTVRGTVVAFDTEDGAMERHVVIEDEASNRVELLPIEVAEPHVGDDVEVTGTFSFDPERGRAIEVSSISAD